MARSSILASLQPARMARSGRDTSTDDRRPRRRRRRRRNRRRNRSRSRSLTD